MRYWVEIACPRCHGRGTWEEDLYSHRWGHDTVTRHCDDCGEEGVVYVWVRYAVEIPLRNVTLAGRADAVEAFEAECLTAWDTGPAYGDPPPVDWLPEGPSAWEFEARTETETDGGAAWVA